MNVEEKRILAEKMLIWLKENNLQTWGSNSDMVQKFHESADCETYDCWKALELLRFCGRIIYNNPNGRKGAHVESYTPIQGHGAFPLAGRLSADKQQEYKKAVDALAKYKFMMFGYHAAMWVHLNKIDQTHEDNPFKEFVDLARRLQNKTSV